MENVLYNVNEIEFKFKQLENLKKDLKKDYFGIDDVINQIIESFKPWYLFPQLQLRPTIVNLWGLTGVGKTSIIKRIVDFLELKDIYLEVDMGSINSSDRFSNSIESKLKEVKEYNKSSSYIFCFDEFQHLRTLSEVGIEEKVSSNNRAIWNLLDKGRFYSENNYSFELGHVYCLHKKLINFINNGVKVNQGRVVSGLDFFLNHGRDSYFEKKSNNVDLEKATELLKKKTTIRKQNEALEKVFVSSYEYSHIMDVSEGRFQSITEVGDCLMCLDEIGTIKLLDEIIRDARKPKEIDCSKSIIFVTGNLDEAYGISQDFTPDIDADIFYQESLKVTISDIKEALKQRFRVEQIARLGNNHILYPALSSKAYESIALKELQNITKQVFESSNLDIVFRKSLLNFILKEGVYPTLGTRPLFTTIDQYVKPMVSKIYQKLFEQKVEADSVLVDYEGGYLDISFINKKKAVFSFQEKQQGTLSEMRKAPKDDTQAIIAVHEAGHVVLNLALLKSIPEVVCSLATSSNMGGFVKRTSKLKYISKQQLSKKLAVYLGGLEAERLVFGNENITMGSNSDITKATNLASLAIKENGFGDLNAYSRSKAPITDGAYFDVNNEMNEKVIVYLKQATELAKKTLIEHKGLLLAIADYLSDETLMNRNKIREFVLKYSSLNVFELDSDGKNEYYRACLKGLFSNKKETNSIAHLALH